MIAAVHGDSTGNATRKTFGDVPPKRWFLHKDENRTSAIDLVDYYKRHIVA